MTAHVLQRLWRGLGWLGVVVTLMVSLMPPALEVGSGHTDKIVHLAGYAVLMFWWAQLVTRQRWKLALAIVLFGLAIEGLQGLTPDRLPDLLDALANSGGVLLGWLVARLLPNLPEHLSARGAILPAPHR
ncbi:MAG: VanZ family protein [Betaproteobacteria bacterium]|mgnify:CR=1 FL=1|nr:VanZ family protein [Betaproteobacteria bacterium]